MNIEGSRSLIEYRRPCESIIQLPKRSLDPDELPLGYLGSIRSLPVGMQKLQVHLFNRKSKSNAGDP